MKDQNFRELLERLRNELATIEVMDEAGRERLRRLEGDIRDLLERSDEPADTDDSMLERLQDSIEHFEETHPQLTLMLSQMMTILSNAGI
jgi:predicted  nucleic acid-binding Zn-ribbon protein